MDINDIIPYERNARRNEKAIPVVAESIREFGLKGQIVLESRENPVIVAGHTRWAACKSLGWAEIPDERIDYCDGLSEDQIRAFRLADNRTGEVATWNRQLLKSEVRLLDKGGVDMSRFRFDFKSKGEAKGFTRKRTDDAYNLGLVSACDCDGEYGMPTLEPCNEVPKSLIPFNYAKTTDDCGSWIHFFKDDYQFERLWNDPEKYLALIKRFDGVLSPDFSLYMDMPYPMQQWNEYRKRALQNYWQRNGVNVIPTISWTTDKSYGFCFDGIPKHSAIAVSTVGIKNDIDASITYSCGMEAALEAIEPSIVIEYGGSVGFDYGGIEVVRFDAGIGRQGS